LLPKATEKVKGGLDHCTILEMKEVGRIGTVGLCTMKIG
jgi:hypothetical protein